ncbi:fungal-specific transcription factor domain-containing protein [Hypomontagnella monticulosa]|nr:fungal-specific transcription factor domain-containing protein [Hypomontagnella monticulosa]
MNVSHGRHHNSIIRSSNGCWTCRLRRKKCDENHPVCDTCSALHITCHYSQDKPEWMDNGARQEEMAERLKREVKENAHRRIWGRAVHVPDGDHLEAIGDIRNGGMRPHPEVSADRTQRGTDCTAIRKEARGNIPFGRSDTILLTFYLEHLFPFLFPFYRPPLLEGGKAWVLEMMISSPVVRKAALCQSSYFFSLSREMDQRDAVWDTVLQQTREAFEMLRQSLQVIASSDITEHPHGAARVMSGIMQVQRFEIALLSFENCRAHLSAALALFRQLCVGAVSQTGLSSSFSTVISRLGPPSSILPAQSVQVPSAEQAAFRFSSALLIFDDIIASTVLQEKPRLYEYHDSLLNDVNNTTPPINLAATVGCQNWVLLQIGRIAALDAWKQDRKQEGGLNVIELVQSATAIKDSLEGHLRQLEIGSAIVPEKSLSLLDVLTSDHSQRSTLANQSSLVTRVWAHAALIYLLFVVNGWQPASVEIRYHVSRIINLLTNQISPLTLLRTMVWPFCVAGCLAEPAQEVHFRGVVEALQVPRVCGTVRKALEIMENVWRNRSTEDITNRDLAACFRSQGDLVLLV